MAFILKTELAHRLVSTQNLFIYYFSRFTNFYQTNQQMANVEDLVNTLKATRVTPSGVSFAGKSLKLDTEQDAKPVTEAIDNCTELQFLNLEGNTLGVDASKGIAKALEKHPEFKRALWKDMFTGRMKTEIPLALEALGSGLVTAGARLTELDMSDNAFGPIGVKGLAALLKSSSCYALEELRLNNNGLGITGGKLLASALTDCYNDSKKAGKPLALKVFIAGRNRLENDGAKALAAVFKMIGTLEEIAMPQNGIYHVGITALSDAFTQNKNLSILNLNDNTIGPKGAEAIANALPHLGNLKVINFGDCLLKTKGAIFLAKALRENHENLEELLVNHNEICLEGGKEIVKALENKTSLKVVNLNGNQFGSNGANDIKTALKNIGKLNALESLSENESEDSEEDDEDVSEEEEENDDESESEEPAGEKTIEEFLQNPSATCFVGLGPNRDAIFIQKAKKNGEICLESTLEILRCISPLVNSDKEEVAKSAQESCEKLYRELFTWAEKTKNVGEVTNIILVNLELIKDEDKKFKTKWNVQGGLKALSNCIENNFVSMHIRSILKFFIDKSANGTR